MSPKQRRRASEDSEEEEEQSKLQPSPDKSELFSVLPEKLLRMTITSSEPARPIEAQIREREEPLTANRG